MKEEALSISQIYARGKENLEKMDYKRAFPPDSSTAASVRANRRYLDSLFFQPRYLSPAAVDTSLTLFGARLRAPVFCSPLSGLNRISSTTLLDIARGLKEASSLMMLGIGSSSELQSVIDTGVPVVKIVKPYRKIEEVYQKVRDAESRGCMAVGMDIDHFYGALRGDQVAMTELFGPHDPTELEQLITQTRLPFIIKGVLSTSDAEEAARIGAAAIIVSTHGNSAIDFAVPSMVALPGIKASAGDKMTVLIDTGFKTGNDILKALAFGASGVGLASSLLLAWGAGGSSGVENLINQITAELGRTMAATGFADLSRIDRAAVIELPFMRS